MMNRILILTMTVSLMFSSFSTITQQRSTADPSQLRALSSQHARSSDPFSAQSSDSVFKSPIWVKDAVFYQIFPDRFRDGDPSNNPVDGDLLWRAWSREESISALKMPWNEIPEEPARGRDWFGGDLKGVQDKAQYLADLGVTAIYLNPTMDSTDNHGYTIIDYKSVNRYFGTHSRLQDGTLVVDPEKSLEVFRNMTNELNKHEIKVILDGVFNHVSAKHQWFDRDNDFQSQGAYENQSSQWYTWFNFYNWPNSYQAWHGFLNLPEVTEVADFKTYVYGDPNDSVIKFWHALGVDGWRLDTGQDINHSFWKGFRTAYKQLNHDGYIVGEFFGDATPWLQGDEWDSVMNYRFRDAVLEWALGGNVNGFDFKLTSIIDDYPSEAFYAAFNLLDSHDTERALTRLGGEKNRMKLAVIFQMTYPGAPVVYYGDEAGMQGLTDPDCRRPYLWQDLGLEPDLNMLEHYKRLISIRKGYSVLRTGTLHTLLTDNANHIYTLVREDNSTNPIAVLIYNDGVTPQTVTVDLSSFLSDGANLTDVLNSQKYKVQDGKITVQLSSLWASILVGGAVALPEMPAMAFPYFFLVVIVAVAVLVAATTYIVLRPRKSQVT